MEEIVNQYFHQGFKYKNIVVLLKRDHQISITVRTLKRYLRTIGLRRNGLQVGEGSFRAAVTEIQETTCNRAGYRRTWHLLRLRHHITATQERTRLCLRELNPGAVQNRVTGVLTRRQYVSPGPNYVWHCDGYDKLKPYGFALHGCVDGFSRKILWIHCSTTNNDPKVILWYYLSTVRELEGIPSILRSDCGTETGLVAAAQCTLANNARSHIYGPSWRNQRIEAWWSVLRKSWSQNWMDLLDDLVTFGAFNPGNHLDKGLAEFCFLRLIQQELDDFKEEWNSHTIRRTSTSGCPGGRPSELYIVPEQYGFSNHKRAVDLGDVTTLMQEASQPPYCTDAQLQLLFQSLIIEKEWQLPTTKNQATELFLLVKDNLNSLNLIQPP